MRKKRPTLQELNLSDDFLFAKVMENEEVCRQLLEKILGFRIKQVRFIESQMTKDIFYDAKGVRLDIFLDDEENSVYTVEMQKSKQYNIPNRARYYHSIIDVDQLLKKGMPYDELKCNFVIFICLFDIFGLGFYQYSFQNLCKEDTDLKLGDGSHTVILNTKGIVGNADDEIKALLKYMEESTDEVAEESGSELLSLIHSRVKKVKADRESEVSYMKFDELMLEERTEGRLEGETLLLVRQVKKKYQKGKELCQIAEELEEDPEQIRQIVGLIAENMSNTPEEIVEKIMGIHYAES